MDAKQLEVDFKRKAAQLQAAVKTDLPRMAVNKAKRFIDGNFRAQGWQGATFMPWKANKTKTTILIKKGKLRRSIRGQASDYTARIWTDSPYARIHNRGFNGTQQVAAFTRNKYTESKIGTGRFTKSGTERTKTVHTVTGTSSVKAFTRNINMPRRQFMPESLDDSPVLKNAIKREVIKTLKNIFK